MDKDKCPVPNGILLVIGGHEEKNGGSDRSHGKGAAQSMEILQNFITLTGKKQPVIEVVTTASSEGEDVFKDYQEAFKQLEVDSIGHIHHDKRSDVLSQNLTERIRKADGIFFSGGDQLKLTSIYGGTQILLTIKEGYIYDKLILAGTSAGAMAFSTPMIFAGNKQVQQVTGEVRVTTGLEFLKDVCIDTHFVDRSRFVRMAQVIAGNPTCIGIGIEENTAIIVRNGIDIDIIGEGIVVITEGYGITDSNILDYGSGSTVSIQDLNVKLLSKGSYYQIRIWNPAHL